MRVGPGAGGGRRGGSALVLGALLVALPALASAHPLVDEAMRRVDQADFAGAEAAFAGAEAASDLTRPDLVALLEGRALLHQALGDTAAVEADLARLAALEPAHAFGPRMPPELAEAFLRVRTRSPGPLRLDVELRPVPGGLAVHATTANDPAGLARSVEVHGSVAGGPWRSAPDELVLTGAPGASVATWAVARGPGGAIVAERGNASAPVAALLPGAAAAADAAGTTTTAGDLTGATHPSPAPRRSSGRTWLWVGVGVVAAAALVTAGVLVWTVRTDDTSVNGPELRGL